LGQLGGGTVFEMRRGALSPYVAWVALVGWMGVMGWAAEQNGQASSRSKDRKEVMDEKALDRVWFEQFEKIATTDIEHVDRGVFRIGKITVDQHRRTMRVPGRILPSFTMVDYVEYLAVSERGGKIHESILMLEVEPMHLNLGCIVMGLKGGKPVRFQGDPKPPQGDPVHLWIEWEEKKGGQARVKRVRVEQLVWDMKKKRPMEKTHWVYTGSYFDEDNRYVPQANRSLIAIFRDPEALIDNPLAGGAGFPIATVGMRRCCLRRRPK